MPTLPGSSYLSTRALLECPRTIVGHSTGLVVDAIITTTEPVNDSRIAICSLILIRDNENMEFVSGVYDIVAKVHYIVPLASPRFHTILFSPFRLFPFAPPHTH